MDSSLVEGQSSLSFVMPNLPKAISGLQMSSAMGVCPNGQYLLYLTTPCDGDERLDEGYGGLQGALDALLSCPSEESKRPRSLEAFLYRQRVDAEIDRLREGTLLPHNLVTISTNGPMHSDCRNLNSHDARAGAMGLAGHLSTMALAEEAFKSHFPGVNWLTDLMEEESSRQDHEDGDRDEIDDLQSALQDLIPQTSASLNKDTV